MIALCEVLVYSNSIFNFRFGFVPDNEICNILDRHEFLFNFDISRKLSLQVSSFDIRPLFYDRNSPSKAIS